MPPEVMDQRRLSFFSQEIRFPAERQIGFWKPEAVHDHCGMEGMLPMSGRKSAPSSPLEKRQSHSVEHIGLLQQSPSRDQKTKFHLEQHLVGLGSIAGRSIASREVTEQSKPDIYAEPVTKSMENRKPNFHGVHHKNCLFSSSLSETLNKNLNLSSKDPFCQHADIVNSKLEKGDPFESLEEIEAQTIGNLLPDDDDLLSGVTNGLESLDCIGRPIIADDTEDDLFYSGGGLELEGDVNSNCNRVSNFVSGRDSSSYNSGLGSAFSSEHSYGEHPSRALFSKNINSSIGDAELKDLLRSLHKASNRENHNQPVGQMSFGFQCMPTFNPVLPDYHDGLSSGIPCNSPGNMPGIPINANTLHVEGTDNRHNHIVASGSLKNHSFEHNNGAFRSLGNHQSCALPGHQFFMNNCRSYQNHPSGSMMWPNSPSFNGIPAQHQQHMHGLPRAPSHMLNIGQPLQDHHVGSAPTLNPSLWDNPFPYAGDPVEASGFHPGSLGCAGFSRSSLMHPFQFASHSISPHSNGSHFEPSIGSPRGGISSPQQRCLVIDGRNSLLRMSSSFNTPNDRARSRRGDANSNQAENKKQYELDTDRILRGEDTRTTLMIKNIPNKYTSKMLLATIDEHHRGTYDFIYLPIDFKNKCNVGYAFINMIDPKHIIPFYQSFNGKKWEKFNSEKVVSLAYARIQGKAALIAHFQNSSLMNEDKRCRPILFHSDGPNAGDQEPFPIGANVRPRPGRCRTSGNLESHQGSPSKSSNEDEIHSATEASSLSPPNNY